jgi:cephalosporin-C deacetylase-like acetyl esterase
LREEIGMREDVEFDAEGATLRGWFYCPDEARGGVPCIVMAHGFSAIKEMHLDDYAEVFCDAGLACVVYDNRGFGASDAAPGQAAAGDRPVGADPRLPACDHLRAAAR